MPRTPMSAAYPLQRIHQTILTRASSAVNHPKKGSDISPRRLAVPPDPLDEAVNETERIAQEIEVPPAGPSAPLSDSTASYYSQWTDEPPSRHEVAGATTIQYTNMADLTSPSSIGSLPLLGNLDRDLSSSAHSPMSANPISPQSHQYGSRPRFTNPFAAESASVPSPYAGQPLRPISEISQNLESPPPYDTIDQDRPLPILSLGNSDSSADVHSNNSFTPSSQQAQQNLANEYVMTRKNSIGNYTRRERVRPTGPRRQLSHANNRSISRNRMPSDASVISTGAAPSMSPPRKLSTPLTEPRTQPVDPPSPDPQPSEINCSPSVTTTTVNVTATPSPESPSFNVPAMPYRGMTMDQAKWTFTSSQLQSIVSRAIKQSAEASSIRLLRLEVLDSEIPKELERLENRRTEIKVNYRSLTRYSETLYSKLNDQIAVGSSILRETLEELRDTTRQLNKLAEELHSVDQQHARIQNLVQTHYGSALSMALRKLNASFLKQLAQAQEFQGEISDLRDELLISEKRTMKLAQENKLAQSQSGPQSSSSALEVEVLPDANVSNSPIGEVPVFERKRSYKAPISRKSSLVRFSRSATWTRASRRSSLGSNGNRSSGVKGVPPVPPLRRRRPTNIITDGPPIRSTAVWFPSSFLCFSRC